MPDFPKPKFRFQYSVAAEAQTLRQHKQTRGVPDKTQNTVLVATWNIANLGTQDRRDQDHRLIAEILSWFDVVAIQEVKDDFSHLFDIQHHLGPGFRVLMSDVAGNNERIAFVYDRTKVTLLEKVGEIAFPPGDLSKVKIKGIKKTFEGFDRTPYLAAFQAGKLSFLLVNVHLYFGKQNTKAEKKASLERRALETFAVARWADLRAKSPYAFTRDIIALGDFNMPKAQPGDPIFNALTSKGLELPPHTSKIGSAIASDNEYDQVAFFPGATAQDFTGQKGIFDYDKVIFPALWGTGNNVKNFNAYLRYYISDHRPMWVEFRI